jgi:hypothetical protein
MLDRVVDMLKVLLMLDCDDCGRSFDHSLVAFELADPYEWSSLSAELETLAEGAGWDFHKSRMRCDGCNSPDHPPRVRVKTVTRQKLNTTSR